MELRSSGRYRSGAGRGGDCIAGGQRTSALYRLTKKAILSEKGSAESCRREEGMERERGVCGKAADAREARRDQLRSTLFPYLQLLELGRLGHVFLGF